jgi:predicted DNA-binding protein (MmcQ/YjbR family)
MISAEQASEQGAGSVSDTSDAVVRELKAWGLTYPGAHSKSPWPGHDDLAVNEKTFAFLAAEGEPFSLSCKLKYTSDAALELPFAKPTGYGLGKSGWVTFTPADAEMPAMDQLKEWIDESYRARAPKKLVKELDARILP